MNDCPAITSLDTQCVNTIRTLSMDAIQKANSGHPGAPMGLAPAAYVLWTRFLKHNPENPAWPDRDRFVLSGGHASMLLYSLLYLTGYGLTLEDLKQFRQWGSKTPGHPEFGHTVGVETTTGPLGQGFTNAVGMAMAERHLASRFNQPGLDLVNHHTFVVCGDGDLMEGITSEAASLAGHLALSRLICLYDSNRISIEGSTDITFTEDVALRFQAYGWNVIKVEDGNNLDAIAKAIQSAKQETEKPSLIVLRTHIAFGSPNKQDSADAHGAPLGEAEVRLTKECLGCLPDEQFCVSDAVMDHFRELTRKAAAQDKKWQDLFAAYQKQFPEKTREWTAMTSGDLGGDLNGDWAADLPDFKDAGGSVATRSASGKVLNYLAEKIPSLIGGSADLAPSNNTFLKGFPVFQKTSYNGRNIRFGVREHAMGGILNGICLHGGLRPFGGTFLVFADYMRPAIRLAALMKQPVIYVFTHDSVAVGEDGPTHQPVEHVASLRLIPNLTVIRPADATETAVAWCHAIRSTDSPTALILSRQNLPVIDRGIYPSADGLENGAYVLADTKGTPDAILIASGSEVSLCLEAGKKLAEQGINIRVVSMPSWELFEKTSQTYKDSVLPPSVKVRVAVEAGLPMGWEKYTGDHGAIIGISTFGASAPGSTVLKHFGFTVENVVETVRGLAG